MTRRNFHSGTDYLVKVLGFTPEEAAVSQREDELAAIFETRLAREKAAQREAIAKGLELAAAGARSQNVLFRFGGVPYLSCEERAKLAEDLAARVRSGEIG